MATAIPTAASVIQAATSVSKGDPKSIPSAQKAASVGIAEITNQITIE